MPDVGADDGVGVGVNSSGDPLKYVGDVVGYLSTEVGVVGGEMDDPDDGVGVNLVGGVGVEVGVVVRVGVGAGVGL